LNADHQAEPCSTEARIGAELWRWAFADAEERAAIAAPRWQLPLLIEFYLSGLFQEIEYTRRLGLWCDGVPELSVSQIDRRTFRIAGVADCCNSSYFLAPFELEFHFEARRGQIPFRVILRFGEREGNREIHRHTNRSKIAMILANRPCHNRDWAVAVELTPAAS